jgi:hypothetical protein
MPGKDIEDAIRNGRIIAYTVFSGAVLQVISLSVRCRSQFLWPSCRALKNLHDSMR